MFVRAILMRVGYLSALMLGAGGSIGVADLAVAQSVAQSVPSNIVADDTLGSERSLIEVRPTSERITGGAVRGINLFHSFSEFNVGEGRSTYFIAPDLSIENVLARVTGGNRSDIFGRLGTAIVTSNGLGVSNANLFLMNPNGIVFGQNAALDVDRSLFVTTASGIRFGDQGEFSATSPAVTSALLTIQPSAFLFGQIPAGKIINNANAPTGFATPSDIAVSGLRVRDGQNLILLGGDISMDGGRLNALGGQIELGGLSQAGIVGLQFTDNIVRLSYPQNTLFSNLNLTNDARVSVRGSGGGSIVVNSNIFNATNGGRLVAGTDGIGSRGSITVNTNEFSISGVGTSGIGAGIFMQVLPRSSGSTGDIVINANNLRTNNSAELNASTSGQGDAGNILINVRDYILLDNSSIFSNVIQDGIGNGGDIRINARSLEMIDRAQLNASTFGKGSAGNILINVQGYIFSANNSSISSSVGQSGIGDGGNIKIRGGFLDMINGAELNSSTFGQGSAGNIDIAIFGDIFLRNSDIFSAVYGIGSGGTISLQSNTLSLINSSRVGTFIRGFSLASGRGDAGDININIREDIRLDGGNTNDFSGIFSAVFQGGVGRGGDIRLINGGRFLVSNGAQVSTATFGDGDAGDLEITSLESQELSGTSPDGRFASGFNSLVGSGATGNGGNLSIKTDSLYVTNGAQVNAGVEGFLGSGGQGDGGNLEIQALQSVNLDNGILSVSNFGKGNAGNLRISAKSILLNQSNITAGSVEGKGGNIQLDAANLIFLRQNSLISAVGGFFGSDRSDRSDGNIALSSPVIFAIPSENSDIVATNDFDQGSNIQITTRFGPYGLKFSDRLTPESDIVATGNITVNTLGFIYLLTGLTDPKSQIDINQVLAQSCFVRRDKPQGTFYILGNGSLPPRPDDPVISDYPTNDIQPIPQASQKPWQIGDPIVEPQGFFKLADGRVIMGRECPASEALR